MTLVVARIVEDNIFIESDSKVTDERLVRDNPLCGLLKTFILHPFVSVSFAGNISFAECALKKFFEQKINDINILLTMLRDINIESGNSTDFLVATIIGKVPQLFKVSDGAVENNIVNAWIGDIDGFKVYQREYHSAPENSETKDKMKLAFKAVIDSTELNTIGDFHISTSLDYRIEPSHPVFLHELKINIDITESQLIKIEEKGRPKSVPLGSREGGSHGISYLSTASPDFHGVAIHYTHGEFGLLFCPQLSFKGILLKDINGRDFVDKIKADYNVPLRGFIKMDNTAVQYIDTREFDKV
jgi:hypothetical protein